MLKCQEISPAIERQIIEVQMIEKAQLIKAHVIRRKVAAMVKDEAGIKKQDDALVKLQSEMEALETLYKECEQEEK